MLKKILISFLITCNFYNQVISSETPTKPSSIAAHQTQETQTDALSSTKSLQVRLAIEIQAQWYARNATVVDLMHRFSKDYQTQLNNLLALAEIESLHRSNRTPEQITASAIARLRAGVQCSTELQANFKALAKTDEFFLGLLLAKIQDLKEHSLNKYLDKAAKAQ